MLQLFFFPKFISIQFVHLLHMKKHTKQNGSVLLFQGSHGKKQASEMSELISHDGAALQHVLFLLEIMSRAWVKIHPLYYQYMKQQNTVVPLHVAQTCVFTLVYPPQVISNLVFFPPTRLFSQPPSVVSCYKAQRPPSGWRGRIKQGTATWRLNYSTLAVSRSELRGKRDFFFSLPTLTALFFFFPLK